MTERYITAIGGSAGALEPLKIFFDHTPNDKVSYVILRHLSPSHRSLLKQILTKHSILEIIEVTDELRLEKNKVYLLPHDKYMVISNQTFHLVERESQGPNRAIDIFLKSAAWEFGAGAIAVILSGAGFDGTNGARYVKEAGGMVIAQQPSSCDHASMPRSVIDHELADNIALPQEMPAIIVNRVQYLSHNTAGK